MKIYPSNKYIPLVLCRYLKVVDTTYSEEVASMSKSDIFNINTPFTFSRDEITKIYTDRSGSYTYSPHILCHGEYLLVIVCKLNNLQGFIDNIIPDKSEWIVLRNDDEFHSDICGRYIKNVLGVKRNQVIKVSSKELQTMFNGEISTDMKIYDGEYQKQLSNEFISLYREEIAV